MLFYIFISNLFIHIVTCDKSTVQVPSNTTRKAVGLVMIPGAQIGADQYIKLGSRIQANSSYSLWVVTVGNWIGNMVNPVQLPGLIEDAIHQMRKLGLPDDAPIFMAAHSLGGVFLDMYVRSNSINVAGVILYGSYISNTIKLQDYPVPVITMAGDQDGMCRITRIIKDFGQLSAYTTRTPVVVVPGVNHSQIASGPMPSLVEKEDLIADKTEDQAHTLLANITNAFIVLNGPKATSMEMKEANKTLGELFSTTLAVAEPFLEALMMDGEGLASWAHWTSVILSGVISTATNVNSYGVAVNDIELMSEDPQVTGIDEQTLNLTVPFHNDLPFNPLDISSVQQTPNQQLVKTIAQSRYIKYLPKATFRKQSTHCNDTTFTGAIFFELTLPIDYLNRYDSRGRQLKFLPDNVVASADEWLTTDVQWDYSMDKVVQLTSPAFSNDKIELCKVVTASRFLEWMLIDAFKKSY